MFINRIRSIQTQNIPLNHNGNNLNVYMLFLFILLWDQRMISERLMNGEQIRLPFTGLGPLEKHISRFSIWHRNFILDTSYLWIIDFLSIKFWILLIWDKHLRRISINWIHCCFKLHLRNYNKWYSLKKAI